MTTRALRTRPPGSLPTDLRSIAVVGAVFALALATLLFRPVRASMPAAGTAVSVAAEGVEGAARQVFTAPVARMVAVELPVDAPAGAVLRWSVEAAAADDPFRRLVPVGGGSVTVTEAGVQTLRLPLDDVPAVGREFTLAAWFEGAGGGRLVGSSVNAYPGRFEAAGRERFEDLRLAVRGATLYSDLRARLAQAPRAARAPAVHALALATWVLALAVFVAGARQGHED